MELNSFTYDANGNRLTSSQSPGPAAGITSRSRTYSITTNTNRLASYSQTDVVSGSPVNTTTTFSVNANGDTTGDGTKTDGFDVESRLASTSTGSSPTISTSRYSHNALGQRTFKTLPVTTSPSTADPGYAFAYDEDGTLIGEYGAADTPSAGSTEYIWLPSPNGPVPVAAVINGTIFAVHADHLNTPRRLSNTSAQAVWQWKYSAFGDEQPTLAANRFADLAMNPNPGTTTIPPVTFNLRYPGQYADVESGLYYNYYRSYDSQNGGRYMQADPIGLAGGWNKFGYVRGNPLSKIDPVGLLEKFSFDRLSGTLNHQCDCPGDVSNPAFSGNHQFTNRPEFESIENHGPIPAGRYYIVEPYHYNRINGAVFFKLYRDDGKIDDFTTLPNGQTRGQFRFHPGTASNGCVTVSSSKNSRDWYRIQDRLLRTTTGTIPGTDITYYGTVDVK